MRAVRLLVIAALSCGTLLVAIPSAGAVPEASSTSKTCKSLRTLQNELDDIDPSDADAFDREAFSDVGDAFHKAAKQAPKQVKSALKSLGDIYAALGGSDNYVEAFQEFGKNGKRYSASLGKFVKFYSTNCS